MNKLLLTFSLVFVTTFSFAQTFNFGVKAGVNLSTVAFNNPSPNYAMATQNLTGFQVGFVADIGFQHFDLQPGVFFITKGQKFTEEESFSYNDQNYSYHSTGSQKFNYLELPVNLRYKIQVDPATKIYAGGGPYMGYGLSGTTILHTTGSQVVNYKGGVTFGADEAKNDYKRFDYGVNFTAGVQLKKHFTIDLNYGLGLKNIMWTPGSSLKNRSIALSIGYLF